jgi:hypothetical protein
MRSPANQLRVVRSADWSSPQLAGGCAPTSQPEAAFAQSDGLVGVRSSALLWHRERVGLVERQFVRTLRKRGQLLDGEQYSAHKQGEIVTVTIDDEPLSAERANELGVASLQPGRCALTYSTARLALIFRTGAYLIYSWPQIGQLDAESGETLVLDIPAGPGWITTHWTARPKEKDVAAFLAAMAATRQQAIGPT